MNRSSGLLVAVLAGGLVVGGCAKNNDKRDEKAPPGVAVNDDRAIGTCEDLSHGASPVPQTVQGGLHYGPVFKLADKDAVAVTKVLSDEKAYDGKFVRLTGRVAEVCEKKGCWLTFGDTKNEQTVFVKFTDPSEGKLVPVRAVGHDITAEGTFKVGQISEAFARELVLDAGGSHEDAMKITGSQKKLILLTPAVTIAGIEK